MLKFYTLALLAAALFCFNTIASAQCDSTYSVTQIGSNSYQFQANIVQQPGYTYTYGWEFAGLGTANTATASYQFPSAGVYQVCYFLQVQDSLGNFICQDTTCSGFNSTTGCFLGLTIYETQYSADSLLVILNPSINNYTHVYVRWDFGDGSPQTNVVAATHTYSAAGNYTVCLYAYDSVSHCADSVCQQFNVQKCPSVVGVNWQQQVDSAYAINFSSPWFTNDTLSISFGDGTDTTFVWNGSSFTHIYPGFGKFPMCWTYSSGAICRFNGCDSVLVDNCSAIYNYTWSASNDTLLQEYFFPGQAFWNNGLYANDWVWYFGDGDSSVLYNNSGAVHNYQAPGTYNACLLLDISGCAPVQHCDSIQISCQLASSFKGLEVNSNTVEYILDTVQTYAGLVYDWTFGDSAVGSTSSPVHVYNQPGYYNTCLTVTDTLYTGCTASSCSSISAAPLTDTLCGHLWLDPNANGIQDPGEPDDLVSYVRIDVDTLYSFYVHPDSNGNYMAVVPDSIQIRVIPVPGYGGVGTVPFFGHDYTYTFTTPNTRQCGLDFTLATSFSYIQGFIYADLNHNGVFDSNDRTLPNQVVNINGQQVVANSGNFTYAAPQGSYTITYDSSNYEYGHFAVQPAQYNVYVSQSNQFYRGNDFAVQVPDNFSDAAVNILPLYNPVVPGYLEYYYVVTSNYGVNPVTATTLFNPTSALTLDTVWYGATVTGNKATWTKSLPGFTSNFERLVCSALVSDSINQDIYDTATITYQSVTDSFPGNNADTCHQVVVASYDPNNKLVNPMGKGPQGFIRGNEELKFVIDFQNTGTSQAINVEVKDAFDPNLDITTFRNIYAPGLCDVQFINDTVYYRLTGIKLPPASKNPTGSHSFVAFGIKPKKGLAPSTQIYNQADIYFDYNTPVPTNRTLHTIQCPAISDTVRASVCPGDSFSFNGQMVPSPGIYSANYVVGAGCDSQSVLVLKNYAIPYDTVPATACFGSNGYAHGGQTYYSATYLYDTLTAVTGCDSIVVTNLSFYYSNNDTVAAAICPGDSFSFGNKWLKAAGTYYDTLLNAGGCDTLLTLKLSLNPTYDTKLYPVICQGDSFYFNGAWYKTAGSYSHPFQTVAGCDSLVEFTLTVQSSAPQPVSMGICPGDSLQFGNVWLNSAGTYTDTFHSVAGCDSVVALTLSIYPVQHDTLGHSMCQGDSVTFYGQVLYAAGTYTKAMQTVHGCDSTVTLVVTVNPTYSDTSLQSICSGDSLHFYNQWLKTAGTYSHSLQTINGCDSVQVLHLAVKSADSTSLFDTICAGSSVLFNGIHYSIAGTFHASFTGSTGCDSAVTLHLTLLQPSTSHINDTICSGASVNFNNQSITAAGTYNDTLTAANGCDSIVTLSLTVLNGTPYSQTLTLCQGITAVFGGDTLIYSGVYTHTFASSSGCDSTVVLTYNILPAPLQPEIVPAGATLTTTTAPTHQWFLNGSAIAGDTGAVITPAQNGWYQVQITGPNGCSNISALYYENQLAINGLSSGFDVKLYPNPNNGQFIVQFSDNEPRSVQITDALGRIVVSDEKVSTQKEYAITGISNGVYFIRVKQQEQIRTLRFVVER